MTNLIVDRQEAEKHLRLLGYNPKGKVYLRFFFHSEDPRKDDDKGRKLSTLNWNQIEKYQNEGRGVYVVVNGGNGRGHTDEHIDRCCAIFCEWDDIPIAEQFEKWSEIGFFEPSFTIFSGDKSMQPYWLLHEPIEPEQWREIQTLLIKVMKADESNKNPSRVFRLAGGWHIKPDRPQPEKSQIVQESDARYSFEELRDRLVELKPEEPESEPELPFHVPAQADVADTNLDAGALVADPAPAENLDALPVTQTSKLKLKDIKLPVPASCPLEFGLSTQSRRYLNGVTAMRNESMAALARDLLGTKSEFDRLGQVTNDDPHSLFIDACRRCATGKGWNEREWEGIWKSASKKTPVSSLTHKLGPSALENCIKSWYWRNIIRPQRQLNIEAKQEAKQNTELDTQKQKTVSGYSANQDEERGDGEDAYSSNILLSEYRRTARFFRGRIRLNKLTQKIEIGGEVISLDRVKLQLAVKHNLVLQSSRENVQDIIVELAEQNEYSPIAEYLLSLPKCEDTSILNTIAWEYFGVSDPIYTLFIRKTLIAAVSRALKPGCKVDTALILQGPQGFKKSSFFKVLAGDYFDDSMGSGSDKDERLKLHRVWWVEWSELERNFGKKDVSSIKAFITSGTDLVRPPYGRDIQEMKRPSIFVGSTNQDDFLADVTGNRRFWVIPVKKKVDFVRLAEQRDEIWAAAVAAYESNELCYLQDDEELQAEAVASEFQAIDPWEDPIERFVANRDFVRVAEILDHLQIDIGRQERSHQMRCSNILKLLRWHKTLKFVDGKRVRGWEPIPEPEPPEPELPALESTVAVEVSQVLESDLPDPPCDLPDPPQAKVDHKVDHSQTHTISQSQKSDLPDLPDLPKNSPQVENLPGGEHQQPNEKFSAAEGGHTSLGKEVDQVDHKVDHNPETTTEQGSQQDPPSDLPCDAQSPQVDHVDHKVDHQQRDAETGTETADDNDRKASEEDDLLKMIRSAIDLADSEFALQVQGILREVVTKGGADRVKVWGALTAEEQAAFKALLPEPISEKDAETIREIARTWWNECNLERLLVMLFGHGQPAHKYPVWQISHWLITEEQLVRDRITELLAARRKEKGTDE